MSGPADLLLATVMALDFTAVAAGRLTTLVRATALEGAALAFLPWALGAQGSQVDPLHIALMGTGTLLLKAVLIPILLLRAIRRAEVDREVEAFVSLHLSILLAAFLAAGSFVLAAALPLPQPAPSPLLVPTAFTTLLLGLLLLVGRTKAVTQVVGYLLLDNGVFLFGQTLARQVPIVVEMGILLDLLVGIFIMGITIHHIREAFDSIDTVHLSALREPPPPPGSP